MPLFGEGGNFIARNAKTRRGRELTEHIEITVDLQAGRQAGRPLRDNDGSSKSHSYKDQMTEGKDKAEKKEREIERELNARCI